MVLVVALLIKSSQASIIAISPVTTVIGFLFASYLFYSRRLRLDKAYVIASVLFIIGNIIWRIKFGENNWLLSINFFLKYSYAYLTVKILGKRLLHVYHRVLVYLAAISVPLYFLQLISYSTLFKVVGILQRVIPFLAFRNETRANIFFFTMESHGSVFRNCGFAWEPKGFVNFLVIGILANLIINRLKMNKSLLVLYAAILTTLSTTGYFICFILIPFWVFMNYQSLLKLLITPIGVLLLVVVLNLDFMLDKVRYELTLTNEYKELLADDRDFESRSLGRIGSLIVDYLDWRKEPVWGYGFNMNHRTQHPRTKLVRVNGLSDWLASFGLVGVGLWLIAYIGFFRTLMGDQYGYAIIPFVAIIIIYFASTLTVHPFWLGLMYYGKINLNT